MARESYFSAGTAPLERFARGVYGALPKSFEEANEMFNPVEILQDAGSKSKRFVESGGRDTQAGVEALVDTATLGVGPAAYGVASLFRTPLKKGSEFATKAIQEAFNPLGASDDRVVDTGVKGLSRRDLLKGMGATAALATVPLAKEVGDLLPTGQIAKATPVKSLLEGSASLYKQLEDLGTQIKNVDKTVESSGDDLVDLFKSLEPNPKVKILEGQQLDTAKKMNDLLSKFTKGLTKKDLMALPDATLIALNKIKHYNPVSSSVGEKAGDPLRKQYKKTADGKTVVLNAEVDELIDEVLKERDLWDPFFMLKEMAQGGLATLDHEARDMFRKPRGIASLTV